MKRRRIVGLVLVIVAVGTFWRVSRQDPAHSFTLPDGSHLYFRGVTLGSNVQVYFCSPVEKLLGQLPGNLGARFQRNRWRDQLDGERLVFWFEFERAQGSNTMVDVQFVDPVLLRTERTESWLPAQMLPNGKIIADCAFMKWPRHEKTLALEVLLEVNRKAVRVGELTVENPGYQSATNRAGH